MRERLDSAIARLSMRRPRTYSDTALIEGLHHLREALGHLGNVPQARDTKRRTRAALRSALDLADRLQEG